jgi:hypothetical protein
LVKERLSIETWYNYGAAGTLNIHKSGVCGKEMKKKFFLGLIVEEQRLAENATPSRS